MYWGAQHCTPSQEQTGHVVGGPVVGGGVGEGGEMMLLSQDPFLGFPFHTQFAALLHSFFARISPQNLVGAGVGGVVGGVVVGELVG